MAKRGIGKSITVLFLMVVLLYMQVWTTNSTVPISSSLESTPAQLADSNIISIDTLELGPAYVSIYDCGLTTYDDCLYIATWYDYSEHGKMIIVDISDPTNLAEVGRVESLASCRQISVLNDRAYVIDSMDGLWIFNVSDPTDVSVLGQFGDNQLTHVYVDNQLAYLTGYSNRVQIVNVSDPTTITEIGYYDTPANTSLSIVCVQDDLAYIASLAVIEIVDVSDPSNPVLVGNVDCYGWKRELFLRDDFLFLKYGGYFTGFNVSDPANPVEILEPILLGYSTNIELQGDLLFSSSYTGLRAYDYHSTLHSAILGQFTPNGDAIAVTYSEGYLYLVDQYNGLWSLEHDCDEDGLYSRQEYEVGTPPDNPDADSDTIPDGWEVEYGLDPLVDDAHDDPDGDTLDNLLEYEIGTNPTLVDTDQDTYSDDWEYNNGFDPLDPTVGGYQYLITHPEWILIGFSGGLGIVCVVYFILKLRIPSEPASSHYGQV